MAKKVNGKYYTQAQAEWSKKYLQNFDEIRIRIPKGEKAELYKEIKKRGYTSMNQFVQDAIHYFLQQ